MNAALAGYYQVPVLMATGDQTVCHEIIEQLAVPETVVVKHATGRYSADCLPPNIAQQLIEQGAKRAIQRLKKQDPIRPYSIKTPIRITVEFMTSDMADRVMLLPDVSREDRKLSLSAEDMLQGYAAFRAMILLAYPR